MKFTSFISSFIQQSLVCLKVLEMCSLSKMPDQVSELEKWWSYFGLLWFQPGTTVLGSAEQTFSIPWFYQDIIVAKWLFQLFFENLCINEIPSILTMSFKNSYSIFSCKLPKDILKYYSVCLWVCVCEREYDLKHSEYLYLPTVRHSHHQNIK